MADDRRLACRIAHIDPAGRMELGADCPGGVSRSRVALYPEIAPVGAGTRLVGRRRNMMLHRQVEQAAMSDLEAVLRRVTGNDLAPDGSVLQEPRAFVPLRVAIVIADGSRDRAVRHEPVQQIIGSRAVLVRREIRISRDWRPSVIFDRAAAARARMADQILHPA